MPRDRKSAPLRGKSCDSGTAGAGVACRGWFRAASSCAMRARSASATCSCCAATVPASSASLASACTASARFPAVTSTPRHAPASSSSSPRSTLSGACDNASACAMSPAMLASTVFDFAATASSYRCRNAAFPLPSSGSHRRQTGHATRGRLRSHVAWSASVWCGTV